MSLSRTGKSSLAILALAACGSAFAGVGEPSAQTLCNAIGSEISVSREAEQAAATKPKARATQSAKPAARAPGTAGGGASRGGGGDATLERRGRWKSFLPGTFK